MKTWNRKLGLVVAFLLVWAMISACNAGGSSSGSGASTSDTGQSNASQSNTSESSASQPDASQDSKEPVTLRYINWDAPEDANKVIQKFEAANPDINIEYESVPYDQYLTKLNTMAASNTLPDVALMNEGQLLAWAEKGVFLDLSEYLQDRTFAAKLEASKFRTPDGKTVGISVANEIVLLFYNKKLFDDAGVPYPPAVADQAWSWEEMLDAARKLTKDSNGRSPGDSGFDPKNIVQYGISIPRDDYIQFALSASNGGGLVSGDGKQLLLDSPETKEAWQKMADLIHQEYVSPTFEARSSLPGLGARMATGRVSMNIAGQWFIPELNNTEGLDYGIGVLPKFKTPVTGNTGAPVVIFNATKHPEEAFRFMSFLANPETSIDLLQNGLWMPTDEAWYTDEELIKRWIDNPAHVPEYRTAAVDYAISSTRQTSFFYLPTWGPIVDIVNPAYHEVLLGQKTVEEAIQEMMPKIRPIFESGSAQQ